MLLNPAHSIPLSICLTLSRVSHSVNSYTILQVLRWSSSLLTPLLRLSHTFQVSQCFLTIDSLSLFSHCSQLFLISLSHFHFLTRTDIVSTLDTHFIHSSSSLCLVLIPFWIQASIHSHATDSSYNLSLSSFPSITTSVQSTIPTSTLFNQIKQ